MKTKYDTPHLEKLRYDYQLLHEAYSLRSPREAKLASLLTLVGLFGAIACAVLWGIL